MKRLLSALALAFLLFIVVDFCFAKLQVEAIRKRLGKENILLELSRRISPGETRGEAERNLIGFRELTVSPKNNEYRVSYGYWFGLVRYPELFKYMGAVTVTYDKQDRVIRSSYWYN